MNCQEVSGLIHLYMDGELELVKSIDIEQHLSSCHTCEQEYQQMKMLQETLRTEMNYYESPRRLEKNIRSALRREDKGSLNGLLGSWGKHRMGLGIAYAVLAVWTLVLVIPKFGNKNVPDEAIVASHIHSLMVDHITDVLSSDQHTVKPWFNGKLDFSPQVTDEAKNNFTLLGGRLDYIESHSAAALVYRRRLHYINLYEWLADNKNDAAPASSSSHGYNLIHWTSAGITYCAISDINLTELEEFAHLIQEAK